MEKLMICFFFFFFFFVSSPLAVVAQRLHTDSRWIVNEGGERVKLKCVNWPSHLDAVVAEGLSKQPLDEISQGIRNLGFNCVRLTWPVYLFTSNKLAYTRVRKSLKNLRLFEAIAGFQINNPSILNLSLINAYKAVVGSLGKKELMIILDNHVSKPGWCCDNYDGNGFFGDEFFDPDLWLKGLIKVATIFNHTKNVVGMSLRNELRGPTQNVEDWYSYMQSGAEAVHATNPNVLVILSGLEYDSDLSFLANKQVSLSFSNKTVFELHWYAWGNGLGWQEGNPNQVCGQTVRDIKNMAGFLLDQGYPLFLSEFGVEMSGTNVNDNRYLNCLMGWAAELDIDWAVWVFAGSYYIRQDQIGGDESYGLYNWNWCQIRNQTMLHKISALQYPFKGPGYLEAYMHKLLFHPMTGLCVKMVSLISEPLVLGPCSEAESWEYSTPEETLTIMGTYLCLQADGLGKAATLGIICGGASSKWELLSDSKMHLSSKLEGGGSATVCLDIDSNNNNNIIVTNDCKCLDNDVSDCDPASQWFKIIDSTRYVMTNKLIAKNFQHSTHRSKAIALN